ncbi:YdaS family helix-turn-helix protein [Agarilytica rhodophyticola]|uniref:YdaS family helix-turn-helix protein n=1 Tax=Agarilytica rhodophyticola TaxID=1737490 RepID=UPI00131A04B5|nr:YdaS family helix-turn-helix protein [Agarilytica rhodophyticola]
MTGEIRKVLSIFGSQSRLARAIGVSNNAVCKWVAQGCLPPSRAMTVFNLVKDKRTPKGEYVSLESLLLDYNRSKKEKLLKDSSEKSTKDDLSQKEDSKQKEDMKQSVQQDSKKDTDFKDSNDSNLDIDARSFNKIKLTTSSAADMESVRQGNTTRGAIEQESVGKSSEKEIDRNTVFGDDTDM